MGKFLESEKKRQAEFKKNVSYFSPRAHEDGVYKGSQRPYCLPRSQSVENLIPEIREPILGYFTRHDIKWHDAIERRPSNHMCDSQVCGVNFLFTFANKPDALAVLLHPIFPDLRIMLPIEDDLYIACEWVGAENYLGEVMRGDRTRTRGANFTSADMAVRFERADGQIEIVLIEWKYTESYYPSPLHIARSGRSRTEIYRHLYDKVDCPMDPLVVGDFGNLFYEPFYQLMRQQFLAKEMERAHEMGADIVGILHIAPHHNLDFRRVTSAALVQGEDTPVDLWKKIVRNPEAFTSVYTEELFGRFPVMNHPELADWWQYIQARYAWVTDL